MIRMSNIGMANGSTHFVHACRYLLTLVVFLVGCQTAPVEDASYGGETSYTPGFKLVLDNFSPEDVQQIETALMTLEEYRHHRVEMSTLTHYEYFYETDANSADLRRDIQDILNARDLQAIVRFHNNEFSIREIGLKQ